MNAASGILGSSTKRERRGGGAAGRGGGEAAASQHESSPARRQVGTGRVPAGRWQVPARNGDGEVDLSVLNCKREDLDWV